MACSALIAAMLVLGCAERPALEAPVARPNALQLAAELAAGSTTAEQVTRAALERIAAVDESGPSLNSIIEINPGAVAIARELDARLRGSGAAGPLHGVPVVIKANIDTADAMATTAGSAALRDHRAAADAELVRHLREAGAVIVAKTNLSEWANFRGLRSSSGWSSLGGQTKNPYVLDRTPCGSSSGSAVAVAAGLVPLAVGTETDGSIVCPAAANGVVGIKPTIGSVSQRGIIPIAATQDVAGPMAATVREAALLLGVLQGRPGFLDSIEFRDDLGGVRIGVLRDYPGAGAVVSLEAAYGRWLDVLEGSGATLLDPVNLDLPGDFRGNELEVLLHEFRDGIRAYLQSAGATARSLEDLVAFNAENSASVMPHFGQELFEMAQQRGDLDTDLSLQARAATQGFLRARLESIFAAENLDVLVAPVGGPAWPVDWENGDAFSVSSSSIAAVSGYPSIAVPAELIGELPVSIAFIGEPDSEAMLVTIAAVFERVRGEFPQPKFVPSTP